MRSFGGSRAASTPGSRSWLERARAAMPGGVSSPVRAFGSVGLDPVFIERGEGARVFDADGRAYVDYVLSWGPLILGHAYPAVVEAIERAARDGTSFGAATRREVELAERIIEWVPAVEMIRFVNSGTEATMSAARLARAATGRDLVIKFTGCYHGHADGFLVSAGSGVATLALPDSPGVPRAVSAQTIALPYNDLDAVERAFARHPDAIAAIIVEPVVGNSGLILPLDGYLAGLRDGCDRHGALLVFDEVMTGFRVSRGGAQERYDVTPDLTTLGKVVGAGLPVAAYGGARDLMERVAPSGPVYQAGTLSGNPLGMAAGLAQLEALAELDPFDALERRARALVDGILAAAADAGVPACGDAAGSMWGVFFHPGPVRDHETAKTSDTELFARYFRSTLADGVYFAPSAFEAGFVSTAHTDSDIRETIDVARRALARAADGSAPDSEAAAAGGSGAGADPDGAR